MVLHWRIEFTSPFSREGHLLVLALRDHSGTAPSFSWISGDFSTRGRGAGEATRAQGEVAAGEQASVSRAGFRGPGLGRTARGARESRTSQLFRKIPNVLDQLSIGDVYRPTPNPQGSLPIPVSRCARQSRASHLIPAMSRNIPAQLLIADTGSAAPPPRRSCHSSRCSVAFAGRKIDFDDPDGVAANETRQPDTVRPGALDPKGLDSAERARPGHQLGVAAPIRWSTLQDPSRHLAYLG